jgi:hypothetical protein
MMTAFMLDMEEQEAQAAVKATTDARAQSPTSAILTLRYLFRRYRDSADDFRLLWKIVWEAAEAGEIEDYQKTGERLRAVFDHRLQALESVRELSDTLPPEDDRFREDLVLLQRNAAEVRKLRDRVFASWPWPGAGRPTFDKVLSEQARRELAAGQGLTKEQVLRDLLGDADESATP